MKTATTIMLSGLLMGLLAGLSTGLPAHADDVEDSIDAALQAYRSGDIRTAKEELDLAAQLLGQMKAEGLKAFLPEPLDGWQRDDSETDVQAMAAFGGGQMASASYSKNDDTVEIQLMADNQMVSAMAGMFSSAAMMGAMGKVQRIQGEKVVVTKDGELQSLVDDRIMVQITGSADVETKAAYFEAMDVKGLKGF